MNGTTPRLIASAAAGLGNAALAECLFISRKTVEKHVGSMYEKLGVRSRVQLAGLLARTAAK